MRATVIRYTRVLTDDPPSSTSTVSVCMDDIDMDDHQMIENNPHAIRKWKVYPGRNIFCCDGRIMMGRQPGVFFFTTALIIITTGLFFGFECPFLATNYSPAIPVVAALLFIFVLGTLFRTSFCDPGIIPRASAAEAVKTEQQIEAAMRDSAGDSYQVPRVREVSVKGATVKLKFCATCKIFRPPRASHCSVCDNCVERFDHHCPWVGNCIGRRNYRYFYLFLVSVSVDCIYVLGCCIATMVLRSQTCSCDFVEVLKQSPTSIIEAVVAFFSLISVIGLAGFHTYLTVLNMTTNEDIKSTYTKSASANPYSQGGWCGNYCEVVCGPLPPSLIDRRGMTTIEEANEQRAFSNTTYNVGPHQPSHLAALENGGRHNGTVSSPSGVSIQKPAAYPVQTYPDRTYVDQQDASATPTHNAAKCAHNVTES